MDEIYMEEAIKQSKKALHINETPVGAVIVHNGKIIAKAYNKKEKLKDSTMHAEIIVIRKACKKLNDWRLNKCSIYVTMEPCYMCIGAIVESRIEKIICGVKNQKYNDLNLKVVKKYNLDIKYGILENKIKEIMKNFFNSIRNR